MDGLRWVFLLACLGCAAGVAWNGRWEGHLTRQEHTWIVDLGRTPVWAPPAAPTYTGFQEVFGGSEGFPAEHTPGLTVRRMLRLDRTAADLLLYLWPVTVVAGLLYLGLRGPRRDLILHLGLTGAIGLTAGALACIGLWVLLGGWGPPAPELFGGVGLVAGLVLGKVSFTLGCAKPARASPPRFPRWAGSS